MRIALLALIRLAIATRACLRTGHVYSDDQKQKMIEWFNRHLGGKQS